MISASVRRHANVLEKPAPFIKGEPRRLASGFNTCVRGTKHCRGPGVDGPYTCSRVGTQVERKDIDNKGVLYPVQELPWLTAARMHAMTGKSSPVPQTSGDPGQHHDKLEKWMRTLFRRMLAVMGGMVAMAASGGHAAYITGQQYAFSGGTAQYSVSGSFTIGAETGAGTGIFNFSSFTADSGAPGTDVLSGIDASDTVTSSGIFSVSFFLANGYTFVSAGGSVIVVPYPDAVSFSSTDVLRYEAMDFVRRRDCGTTPLGPFCTDTDVGTFGSPEDGTFSVRLTNDGSRVPEPGVIALLGLAASAGAHFRRRRR